MTNSTLSRRGFAALGALGAAGLFAQAARAEATKPNVLLFLCDQMRLPRWWPESARLPNLERLAARGVSFQNHFVSAVPCSPSRACLLTGLHIDQHGVKSNVTLKGSPSLDPRIPTLGTMFREAGYRTPYFGKWHLSLGEKDLGPYGFRWLTEEETGGPLAGVAKDRGFTDAATRWLRKNGKGPKPWFLTLSVVNPHDICSYPRIALPDSEFPSLCDTLPGNFNDDLSGKPRCQSQYRALIERNNRRFDPADPKVWLRNLDYYYALTLRIDALLGRVLDTLAETGLDRDTIVIFTSDHGDMAGSHGLRLKGPFPYVENTNVPLVISRPGALPEGVRTEALCQNVDLFPTLASMIGATPRLPLPGRDLGPVLADPASPGPGHVLFSFTSNIAMMTASKATGGPTITAPQNIRALRTPEAVFARYFDPQTPDKEFELYDETNDPLEMRNLAADPAAASLRRDMEDRLREAEQKEMAPIVLK